jgi:3-oxoadipate enol-lactonase
MATLELDGVAIEQQGESTDAVLCLHGLGGSSNIWTPVLPAFGGRRVVRLDLPGSARSSLPQRPLSIAVYLTTVIEVLNRLNLPSIHVVAHSMGTIIAQHLAHDYPERIKSLALLGPLTAPSQAARAATQARASLARQGMSGLQEIADAVSQGATSTETKESRPVTLALIRESLMRQTPEGYARSCEAFATATAVAVERIAVPTLLVTGSEDGVATPGSAEALAARIPGAEVLILSGCGHWATYEKPFECRTALERFLGNVGSSTSS